MSNDEVRIKITQLRKGCGWSQARLAKEAGITASAICMIESGNRYPSLDVAIKISQALNASISELTGGIEPEQTGQDAKAFAKKFGVLKYLDKTDQQMVLDFARRLKRDQNNGPR